MYFSGKESEISNKTRIYSHILDAGGEIFLCLFKNEAALWTC
ncbi:Transcriptional regulator, MarR family (fragment) [Xenorhabdus bovienii str. Intermedium]|uniref:Transcriptional regulator, MarR family n=1 Tax=Xenorhabdus bovienii str. Intermedium TaxID=1379677 RepID=A0A077QH05_XENBV